MSKISSYWKAERRNLEDSATGSLTLLPPFLKGFWCSLSSGTSLVLTEGKPNAEMLRVFTAYNYY